MKDYLQEACESIDATFFSSYLLDDRATLYELEEYLDRWNREVKSIKDDVLTEGGGANKTTNQGS